MYIFIFTAAYRGFVDVVDSLRDIHQRYEPAPGSFFILRDAEVREFLEMDKGTGPGFQREFEVPREWLK